MDLENIFKRMTALENFASGVPATDNDISAMECTIGVVFPEAYKAFLAKFGFANWFGGSIFGFDPIGATKHLGYDYDAVRSTLNARSAKPFADFSRVLSQSVVLARYSAGGYFVLENVSNGSSRVILLDMDTPGRHKTWESFRQFLEYML
jgi:hypothetical protein